MIEQKFLNIIGSECYEMLTTLKYWNTKDTGCPLTKNDFAYVSLADKKNSGVYSDGSFIISWIRILDDGSVQSLVTNSNIKSACFAVGLLRLATKVSTKISDGLPWGQVSRDVWVIFEHYDDLVNDLDVVLPDFEKIDVLSDGDVITAVLKAFADRSEFFMRDCIAKKFGSYAGGYENVSAADGGDNFEEVAREYKTFGQQYKQELQQEDTIFVSDYSGGEMRFDSIEIFDVTINKESQIVGTCPKCNSDDVFYMGANSTMCYGCGHEWRAGVNVDYDQMVTDLYRQKSVSNAAEQGLIVTTSGKEPKGKIRRINDSSD